MAQHKKLNASVKPIHEVQVIEVHKIIHFLLFGNDKVKKVKYCPTCRMPNLAGSVASTALHCETCFSMWMAESFLKEATPEDYLKILRRLPLRNQGKMLVTQMERVKMIGQPPVCYNDLSEEDLLEIDKYAKIYT